MRGCAVYAFTGSSFTRSFQAYINAYICRYKFRLSFLILLRLIPTPELCVPYRGILIFTSVCSNILASFFDVSPSFFFPQPLPPAHLAALSAMRADARFMGIFFFLKGPTPRFLEPSSPLPLSYSLDHPSLFISASLSRPFIVPAGRL